MGHRVGSVIKASNDDAIIINVLHLRRGCRRILYLTRNRKFLNHRPTPDQSIHSYDQALVIHTDRIDIP